jgi:hypothetical protein
MNKNLFTGMNNLAVTNKKGKGNMKIFYENFASAEDVFDNFTVSDEGRVGVEFVYADYDTPSYEGYAHVIFMKDGKLFEVNGSHCSCYGLEGQWEPEETSVAALLARPNVSEDAKANLKQLLM